MEISMRDHNSGKPIKAYLLIIVLIFLAYSNSLRAGWHFDDVDHITGNSAIQIRDLTRESISSAIYAAPRLDEFTSPYMHRPLATLTFALNWYFGQDDVFGYHLVNIIIHLFAACLLFKTICLLYRTPRLESDASGRGHYVALLAAGSWAVNPLQTQAVTYIVQRMASMSAMFFMLALVLYLKGRLSDRVKPRLLYFSGTAAALVCALGAKENAVVFPAALLLVEIIFFNPKDLPNTFKKTVVVGGIVAAATGLIGILVFANGDPLGLLEGFAGRPYTLVERLMTQPRVLLFHLSQLIFPIPSRLSIQHDITHSVSLTDPWTTLPSIGVLLLLIGYSLYSIRKRPLLSFAVLFFFLGHIVESTILPLELVFEHRNYLPSMFLFLPLSAAIVRAETYLRARRPDMAHVFRFLVVLIVAAFCIGTYTRNTVWADEFTLWQDALSKAKKFDRPYINLARAYDQKGDFNAALNLYGQALGKYSERKTDYQLVVLTNVGRIFFERGDYPKAIELWSYAVDHVRDHSLLRKNLALAYARLNEWNRAVTELELALAQSPHQPEINFLRATFLIELGRYDDAIVLLNRVLSSGYEPHKTLALKAVVSYHQQDFDEAERLLKLSALKKDSLELLIWLLAVNLNLDDQEDVHRYLDEIHRKASTDDLQPWVERMASPDYHLFRDKERITAALAEKFHYSF
jgi:tetratricopeptide (TPR) repeat protein